MSVDDHDRIAWIKIFSSTFWVIFNLPYLPVKGTFHDVLFRSPLITFCKPV
jgi:hypothetical protein